MGIADRVTTDGTTRVTTDGTTRVIDGILSLGPDIGVYAITGGAAALGTTLNFAAGSYSITGGAAALGTTLNFAAGSYSITGGAAALTLSDTPFLWAAGAYTISGGAAALDTVRDDDAGSYSITGASAALYYDRVLGTSGALVNGSSTTSSGPGVSTGTLSTSLTTTYGGGIVVVYVATVSTGGYKAVSSVTASGLTFASGGGIANWTRLESDGNTYYMQLEMWYADSPNTLTSETITANTATVTGGEGEIAIAAISIPSADTSNLFNFSEIVGTRPDAGAYGLRSRPGVRDGGDRLFRLAYRRRWWPPCLRQV